MPLTRFQRRLFVAIATACVAGVGTAILAGQTPLTSQVTAPSLATISGTLIDGTTGDPVAGAEMFIAASRGRGAPTPLLTTTTDEQGRFALRGVPPGSHVIEAAKPGYRGSVFGQFVPAPPIPERVTVAAGDRRDGLLVRIWKAGSIGGSVRLASGTPLLGATVMVGRIVNVCGVERIAAGPRANTDDRGRYVFENLPPARYVVETQFGTSDPTTYHPATLRPSEARVLDLAAGRALSDIDVVVRVSGRTVSGRLAGAEMPAGASFPEVALFADDGGPAVLHAVQRVRPTSDGRFEFRRIPVGRYRIRAVAFPEPAPEAIIQFGPGSFMGGMGTFSGPLPAMTTGGTWWAESGVEVADRDVDLALTLQRGHAIEGRLSFDAVPAERRPDGQRLMSTAVLTDRIDGAIVGSFQAARVESDGRFRTVEFPPGRYTVRVLAMEAIGYQRAITAAGRDLTSAGIEVGANDNTGLVVTMMDRPSGVYGTVPVGTAFDKFGIRVYVFPAAERDWSGCGALPLRFQVAQAAAGGRYEVPSLPPGEYLVAAAVGAEQSWDSWMQPAFLRSLVPMAQRLALDSGDRREVNLTAVLPRR